MKVSEIFQAPFERREFPDNPREVIGGNNPPSPIDESRPAYKRLAQFLKDTPAIEDEAAAILANENLAIGKAVVKTLSDAQSAEADPLYSEWKAARAKYQGAIDNMSKVVDEVADRLKRFMLAEEARRQHEADEKRRLAEEAEHTAREAERLEAEARENAAVGEVGVDVAAAIEQADTAFAEFKKSDREANVAEKDATVRFRSRFAAKATSLRTVKTLVLVDASKAIAAMGITEKIKEAIISSARDYRKEKEYLPDGITETEERTI